jgi:hypothetical protein
MLMLSVAIYVLFVQLIKNLREASTGVLTHKKYTCNHTGILLTSAVAVHACTAVPAI